MGFDHDAAQAQVARCIAHAAGDTVLLRFGALAEVPAILKAAQPDPMTAQRNDGARAAVVVSVARVIFGAALPRQGQHFTDAAGRTYRITDASRAVPHAPRLEYVCAVSEPSAA